RTCFAAGAGEKRAATCASAYAGRCAAAGGKKCASAVADDVDRDVGASRDAVGRAATITAGAGYEKRAEDRSINSASDGAADRTDLFADAIAGGAGDARFGHPARGAAAAAL